MSVLLNGIDDNAMIAAIAWEIVNYDNIRIVNFSEKSSEQVMVTLTNVLNQVKKRSITASP
jgi:hypothetical protein